jgi:glutaredoxin
MAAREAYERGNTRVEYVSVIDDPDALEKMLALSKGKRKIPVIVVGNTVTTGFKGKG